MLNISINPFVELPKLLLELQVVFFLNVLVFEMNQDIVYYLREGSTKLGWYYV